MPELFTSEDIDQIRKDEKNKAELIRNAGSFQVFISLGTPAIAAGAYKIKMAFEQLIIEHKLSDVVVHQTGNSCLDSLEPVVRVAQGIRSEVMYAKVTPQVARRIIEEHIIKGEIVEDNLIVPG